MENGSNNINVTVEFSGGLELLFDNKKNLALEVPEGTNVEQLIVILKDQHLKEHPELFYVESSLRPGVLVLINETDWELEGEGEYVLQNRDSLSFISTLHGG
jgi:ubiquitin related modifier 1